MQADVKNLKGETVKSVELPADIFEAPINIDLMHQAYQRQMANARPHHRRRERCARGF